MPYIHYFCHNEEGKLVRARELPEDYTSFGWLYAPLVNGNLADAYVLSALHKGKIVDFELKREEDKLVVEAGGEKIVFETDGLPERYSGKSEHADYVHDFISIITDFKLLDPLLKNHNICFVGAQYND